MVANVELEITKTDWVEFAPQAALVRTCPSPQMWRDALARLLIVERGVQWWIGDLFLAGERWWGERVYQYLAEVSDYERETF